MSQFTNQYLSSQLQSIKLSLEKEYDKKYRGYLYVPYHSIKTNEVNESMKISDDSTHIQYPELNTQQNNTCGETKSLVVCDNNRIIIENLPNTINISFGNNTNNNNNNNISFHKFRDIINKYSFLGGTCFGTIIGFNCAAIIRDLWYRTNSGSAEESKYEKYFAGMKVFSFVSFGIYLFSSDEYLQLYLKNEDATMKFANSLVNAGMSDKVKEFQIIKQKYDTWKAYFTRRTLPILIAKIFFIGSCAVNLYSKSIRQLLVMENEMTIVGLFGMFVSGTYILWKNLCEDISDEAQMYQKIITEIEKFNQNINIHNTSQTENRYMPSAPPAVSTIYQ